MTPLLWTERWVGWPLLPARHLKPLALPPLYSVSAPRQPAQASGLAVLSTIATTKTHHVLASGGSNPHHALTAGFHSVFLGGAVAALGFLAGLILIRSRDSRAHLEMANSEAASAHA